MAESDFVGYYELMQISPHAFAGYFSHFTLSGLS